MKALIPEDPRAATLVKNLPTFQLVPLAKTSRVNLVLKINSKFLNDLLDTPQSSVSRNFETSSTATINLFDLGFQTGIILSFNLWRRQKSSDNLFWIARTLEPFSSQTARTLLSVTQYSVDKWKDRNLSSIFLIAWKTAKNSLAEELS